MTRDVFTAASPVVTSPADNDPIVIGLVNNMPDASLQTTERQFMELLAQAAGGRPFKLKIYSLPEVPRSENARAYIAENYGSIGALWSTPLDGLIVTGTQPRASDLLQEPYWPSLAKLVDWAEDNTESALWSCLAAHAAVLRLDGIQRRPLEEKLSGVFSCKTSLQHTLAAGLPSSWQVPHSRYFALPPELLLTSGYRILSHSDRVGADLFIKQRNSLFVFCQGHLEYDRCTLMREYRADITAFLAGDRKTYPGMPCSYFDAESIEALATFRERAERERSPGLFAELPLAHAKETLTCAWRSNAVLLYENWISHLAERKCSRSGVLLGTGRRDSGGDAFIDRKSVTAHYGGSGADGATSERS